MICANINKASQDSKIKQQQQQKLITSKTSCPFLKKINNKAKIQSDKTDIK